MVVNSSCVELIHQYFMFNLVAQPDEPESHSNKPQDMQPIAKKSHCTLKRQMYV